MLLGAAHPFPQVVGQQQVSGEVVGEGRVELQHLLQSVALNDVEVAVGQSSDVGAGLGEGQLLPEHVPKDVPLPCRDKTPVELFMGERDHFIKHAMVFRLYMIIDASLIHDHSFLFTLIHYSGLNLDHHSLHFTSQFPDSKVSPAIHP